MSNQTEPARIEILTAAANGNAAALEFLVAFARRAHWLDDISDQKGKASATDPMGMIYYPASIAAKEAEWLMVIGTNQFFLANRASLLPAMRLALRAWADSDTMSFDRRHNRPADAQACLIADVVKGQWHEVVWLVADLCGGWFHLEKITAQYRKYDVEEVPIRMNGIELRKELNGLPGR